MTDEQVKAEVKKELNKINWVDVVVIVVFLIGVIWAVVKL